MRKNRRKIWAKGFTLVELLVVISIISLLASVVLTTVNSTRAKARDVRRKTDIRQLLLAIQFYYDNNGQYPPVVDNRGDGWDQSYDGTFMPNLVPQYIPTMIIDPAGTGNAYRSYYYRIGNYSSPPFCPVGTQAILHFYLDAQNQNYTLCSDQNGPGPTYGHCICFN